MASLASRSWRTGKQIIISIHAKTLVSQRAISELAKIAIQTAGHCVHCTVQTCIVTCNTRIIELVEACHTETLSSRRIQCP
jgi:hypothetical protein